MKQEDIPLITPKNGTPDQAAEDDAGSLVSAREDGEHCDTDDELPTAPLMSRSRTIEEVDFRATFGDEKKVTPDANLAPRRHNVLFALMFFILFVAAMFDQRGRIQPNQHKPCEYGSSQKRDMGEDGLGQDGLPRKDLLNNCQNLAIWPESLQPSTTSTFPSYPTLNGEKKARWAATYTNISSTIPMSSASTMAPVGESAPNSTCSTEGQFTCNGPDYFGLCSHGLVIWHHVSNGTQCKEGEIIGTDVPTNSTADHASLTSYGNGLGSATAWGPPDISAEATMTMPFSDGTTFQTMVHPTGNASMYGNDTDYSGSVVEKLSGYRGRCHAEGNRHVGVPDMCYCYPDVDVAARVNTMHAISHACKYFESNHLGPAGQDWKQVLASNFMYKDGDKMARILIKMQYWGDVNGNDISQGGPCHIFQVSWGQCTKAFTSVLDQCSRYAMNGQSHYASGYGMDSCAMWTIDHNPEKNKKKIPETINGNYDYFLFEDPARNPKSKISSASVTWPEPTTPRWAPASTKAPKTTTFCKTGAGVRECFTTTLS